MTIEFKCPQCSKLLRTSDDKAGLRAKCPNCGAAVTMPSPHGDTEASEWDLDEPDDFLQSFGGGGTSTGGTSTGAEPTPETGERSPCPMCGEMIAAAARRCRFCGDTLGESPVRSTGGYAPTSGWSIAAFVLGIVGLLTFCFWKVSIPCNLLAIGLGIAGIRAARTGQRQGEGLAIAGLSLGVLGLLLGIVILVFLLPALNGR